MHGREKEHALIDAFNAAGYAKYQARIALLTVRDTDSDVGALAEALRLGLDRLSLQSRAISEMVPVDLRKAEDLLQQIMMPAPQSLSCDDLTRYDVSPFYEAVEKVLNAQTSPVKRLALAEWLVGTVLSPIELEPSLRIPTGAAIPALDKGRLLGEIAARMRTMTADDPRTASSTLTYGLNQAVWDALDTEAKSGDRALLLGSYREFIASNVKAVCSDDRHFTQRATQLLEFLARDAQRLGVSFGGEVKVAPEVIEGKAKAHLYWEENGSKEIWGDFQRLEHELSVKELNTPLWIVQLHTFLDNFRYWQDYTSEPEDVRFGESCEIYGALIHRLPPGETRDNLLKGFIDYLQFSSTLTDNPPLWYLQVNTFMSPMEQGKGTMLPPQIAGANMLLSMTDRSSALGFIALLNQDITKAEHY
jgi:hypothetical protein